VRIVCLSDTHNRHDALRVPEGDVLVHAGDATMHGTAEELEAFDAWLGALPHRHKLVIAGNHDFIFQQRPSAARDLLRSALYLEDSEATIEGLRFWGSPWQPWFFDWAFNLKRGAPLREKWALIPEGIDVLVTHGPPHGILDLVGREASVRGQEHVGCEELLGAVLRLRPRVHVFGHIHEGYGREARDGIEFVNACNCDRAYRALNAPLVVDL
jgi:predicted phosphodiesterase